MAEPLEQRPEVRALVASAPQRYESVPPDPDYAGEVVEEVVRSELDLVMVGTDRGRYAKALTLAYDAARKSVEALMLAMGLRTGRGEGSHLAVTDLAEAEFVDSSAERRDAGGFASARIARNADEYPRPGDVERSEAELRALAQACARMVGHCRRRLGLDPRADLVPTDAKIDAYLRGE